MTPGFHDKWSAELLRRALSQTDDIELALEAVVEALRIDPEPPKDDRFWHELPDFGEAFRILDAAVEELQPDLDAARAIVGRSLDLRP